MDQTSSLPWWRYGHVWLVVSGPAVVVVAGFITLYLAVDGADTLVNGPPAQPHRAAVQATVVQPDAAPRDPQDSRGDSAMVPAIVGRNHAATGVPAKP